VTGTTPVAAAVRASARRPLTRRRERGSTILQGSCPVACRQSTFREPTFRDGCSSALLVWGCAASARRPLARYRVGLPAGRRCCVAAAVALACSQQASPQGRGATPQHLPLQLQLLLLLLLLPVLHAGCRPVTSRRVTGRRVASRRVASPLFATAAALRCSLGAALRQRVDRWCAGASTCPREDAAA
jgi:hypothetical protein